MLEISSKLLIDFYFTSPDSSNCASIMDHRIEEIDESGRLTATYVESSSNGKQRIDVIVSQPLERCARPSHKTVPHVVG